MKIKRIQKKILIPPLVGMIISGMIVRNFFGDIMLAWPSGWV